MSDANTENEWRIAIEVGFGSSFEHAIVTRWRVGGPGCDMANTKKAAEKAAVILLNDDSVPRYQKKDARHMCVRHPCGELYLVDRDFISKKLKVPRE